MLSGLIRVAPLDLEKIDTLCGFDVSYRGDEGVAAAVVWSRGKGEIVETATFRGVVPFPYVPGLLYAREAPLILAALKRLKTEAGLLLVDGHGLAHPRRAGLASIVGLMADRPSIGVAKSLLHGEVREVGGIEYLEVAGERVGVVLCSGSGKRYFVSVGHRVDFGSLLRLVQCLGEELLRPLREAHRLSRRALMCR